MSSGSLSEVLLQCVMSIHETRHEIFFKRSASKALLWLITQMDNYILSLTSFLLSPANWRQGEMRAVQLATFLSHCHPFKKLLNAFSTLSPIPGAGLQSPRSQGEDSKIRDYFIVVLVTYQIFIQNLLYARCSVRH